MKKPVKIVEDLKYPGMWRIQWEDGILSDMYNLTRAHNHLQVLQETYKRWGEDQEKKAGHSPVA